MAVINQCAWAGAGGSVIDPQFMAYSLLAKKGALPLPCRDLFLHFDIFYGKHSKPKIKLVDYKPKIFSR